MSIPVFIHHEINCGNVRGMGSSDYPLYALQSAKKYNESFLYTLNQGVDQRKYLK